MICPAQTAPTPGGALLIRVRRIIETVLHIGAHRCATTTFQAYLDQNRAGLAAGGIAAWTPALTRSGLFAGLVRPPGQNDPDADAACARRVRNRRRHLDAKGIRQLLVSEENMIGTPRDNLSRHALYPGLLPRLTRFKAAFAGQVDRIGLVIRSYEAFWASSIAFAVTSGHPVPDAATCARVAEQPRCWSDLVREIRQLFPDAPLHVWTFEAFAGRPRRQFTMLSRDTSLTHLLDQTPVWANRSRDSDTLRAVLHRQGRDTEADLLPMAPGPWMPFNGPQRAALAVLYADDLTWLRQADDPLLTFTEQSAIKVPSARTIHRRASGD